jgi:uroporphyrinogen-III synthase
VSAGLRESLAGGGIVITRPAGQCDDLVRLVRSRGGNPIVFPAIEVLDPSDHGRLNAIVDRLDAFDLAIFVSRNAATRGLSAIRATRELPPAMRVLAIGQGTARELRRQGIASVIAPDRAADSEALLDLPELHAVNGLRVVIFRGEGGRALLGETLAARGASVEYAECYRRAKPRFDGDALMRQSTGVRIDAFIATSSEGLRNLHEMLGEAGRSRLSAAALFVPHARIAATARALGLTAVIVTPPGDEAIVAAMSQHFDAVR